MNNIKRNAGISLVALIITIIVLIILTAAVIIVGVNTPENNEYAVKMHNKATLQDAVTLYVMTEMLNDIDNFVITSTGATKARDVADVVKDLYENGTWKQGAELKLGVSMTLDELNTVFELDNQAVVTFAAGQEPTLDGTQSGNNNQSSSSSNNQPVTLQSVLSGKNFSILGDSISTYVGYSNNATTTNSTIGNNAIYYNVGTCGLTSVHDTWWMQAINETGMNLLVNNSWSGDTVGFGAPPRAMQLHDDTGDNAGTNPDIVAVYMGINDMRNGYSASSFKTSYATMVSNISTTYPNADIFLFTHVPYYYGGAVQSMTNEQLETFNSSIRTIASQTPNCFVVDLFADSGINQDNFKTYMGDMGLHPNALGMDAITNTLIKAFEEKYL